MSFLSTQLGELFFLCYFIELKNFAIYHKRVTDFDILVGDVEQDELVRSRLDATAVVITVVTGTAHFGVTFILLGELHNETVIPLLLFKLLHPHVAIHTIMQQKYQLFNKTKKSA